MADYTIGENVTSKGIILKENDFMNVTSKGKGISINCRIFPESTLKEALARDILL